MKLPLSSIFQDIFQAFCPLLCCSVSLGLVCTLYTGGLCAFPCLSPCSCSNLLPSSILLPLPLSACPVVAMPPHHTVIIWSLMATMIRVCTVEGDCLYADCKLLLSHWLKWLLPLNELQNANNPDVQMSRLVLNCMFTSAEKRAGLLEASLYNGIYNLCKNYSISNQNPFHSTNITLQLKPMNHCHCLSL